MEKLYYSLSGPKDDLVDCPKGTLGADIFAKYGYCPQNELVMIPERFYDKKHSGLQMIDYIPECIIPIIKELDAGVITDGCWAVDSNLSDNDFVKVAAKHDFEALPYPVIPDNKTVYIDSRERRSIIKQGNLLITMARTNNIEDIFIITKKSLDEGFKTETDERMLPIIKIINNCLNDDGEHFTYLGDGNISTIVPENVSASSKIWNALRSEGYDVSSYAGEPLPYSHDFNKWNEYRFGGNNELHIKCDDIEDRYPDLDVPKDKIVNFENEKYVRTEDLKLLLSPMTMFGMVTKMCRINDIPENVLEYIKTENITVHNLKYGKFISGNDADKLHDIYPNINTKREFGFGELAVVFLFN